MLLQPFFVERRGIFRQHLHRVVRDFRRVQNDAVRVTETAFAQRADAAEMRLHTVVEVRMVAAMAARRHGMRLAVVVDGDKILLFLRQHVGGMAPFLHAVQERVVRDARA